MGKPNDDSISNIFLEIPSVTAHPFQENDLFEYQVAAAADAWKSLLEDKELIALEYALHRAGEEAARGRYYLTQSTYPGVDLQLTYVDASGLPVSHANIMYTDIATMNQHIADHFPYSTETITIKGRAITSKRGEVIVAENSNQQVDRVKELTDKLETGVKEVFSGGRYAEYLAAMGKFHNYSARNTLLILMQKPNATAVMGYGAWQKNFQRQVQKGEKAIYIIAPMVSKKKVEETQKDGKGQPVKNPDGSIATENKEVSYTRYRAAAVFDVSQTEGKPLPTLAERISGDVENFPLLREAIEQVSPVPVHYEDIDDIEADGYFSPSEKKIVLDKRLSELETISTLVHEVSHAKMHNKELPDAFQSVDKNTREVQAESVAFVVSSALGLDTSNNSFPYIASYSSGKETKELLDSLSVIQGTASNLIGEIEKNFDTLLQGRGVEKSMSESIPQSPDKKPSIIEKIDAVNRRIGEKAASKPPQAIAKQSLERV